MEIGAATDAAAALPGTDRARRLRAQLVALVLVLAPAVIVTWAFRPGYMNADTLIQYDSTLGARLDDWYAPVIQRLWDAAAALGVGKPTEVLFAQTLALTLGCYLVLRAAADRTVAAIAAALLVFAPPVLAQVMLLGRDTWLTALVALQTGCSIRWTQRPGWRGQCWLVASLVAAVLGIAARQNAAPIVALVLLATVHRGLTRRQVGSDVPAWRTALLSVGGATAGTVAMLVGVGVLTYQVFGATDRRPEALLFAYDLSGVSVREGELLLGPEAFPAQDLNILRDRWDPHSALSVLGPAEQDGVLAVDGEPADELARAWRDEIPGHLGAYLSVRWELFRMQIGVSDRPTVVVHPGVDDNGWGYAIANPGANRWFRSYLGVITTDDSLIYGTAPSRPIWYLVVAVGSSAFLLRRRRRQEPGGLEVGFLALGSLAYMATFFVAAMGAGYRYAYPSVVLGLLSGTFVVLTLVRDRWRRRPILPEDAPQSDEGGLPKQS